MLAHWYIWHVLKNDRWKYAGAKYVLSIYCLYGCLSYWKEKAIQWHVNSFIYYGRLLRSLEFFPIIYSPKQWVLVSLKCQHSRVFSSFCTYFTIECKSQQKSFQFEFSKWIPNAKEERGNLNQLNYDDSSIFNLKLLSINFLHLFEIFLFQVIDVRTIIILLIFDFFHIHFSEAVDNELCTRFAKGIHKHYIHNLDSTTGRI